MKVITTLLFILMVGSVAEAQQEIPLYDGAIPNSKTPSTIIDTAFVKGNGNIDLIKGVLQPSLTAFLPPPAKVTGAAVIICPGGGYGVLAITHEGYAMAKRFNDEGITAFVLKYRLPNDAIMHDKKIGPLQDAQRAMQLVRENAKRWNINPNKIGILGSSAGGHLASTAGTHFQKSFIDNPSNTNLRPDFMILNYPVISFADSITHAGSKKNLIGLNPSEEDVRFFSNEHQVTAKTPPTFITSALTDKTVPVANSLAFVAALQQNKVSVETFFYQQGKHGYGMINPKGKEQWIDACLRWVKKNFDAPPLDWPNLRKFQADNMKIGMPKTTENRIVFMGNSITEGWPKFDSLFWKNKSYVNRGIGGQTTPQMLLRFKQDVIDLKPKVVVILAGINDIAGNTGPMTLEQTRDNIIEMAQLAQLNGIRVVISSVLPAFDFPWRPGMEPAEKVVLLNAMLKAFCDQNKIIYLDYHTAMKDERNGLQAALGYDGVHPNLEGYKVMAPLAERAIAAALKQK